MATEQTKISELNEAFTEAETVDKEIFSEQRSNLLLIAGEHYVRKGQTVWNNIRARADVTTDQKIRLTMNHVQKIHKIYVNNVVSSAPGVIIEPQTSTDIKDKKSAELRQSVWEWGKRTYRLKEQIRDWAHEFNGFGEVFTKVFWDPDLGEYRGDTEEPILGEDGQPAVDEETGQPKTKKSPRFSGAFVFEKVYPFNVLRSPTAKDFRDSPYLIIRKMAEVKPLKAKYKNDEKKTAMLEASDDKTYVVFDAQRGQFSKTRSQVMIREYYYRPCVEYPKGYFYITTEAGILEEGELPFGRWPLAQAIFEKIPTTCRGRSPVKHMRPYQIEINRAASKIAEQQITLGDDKILIQNGTKLEQGGTLPGVRGVKVSGTAPTILPGRDGMQYLPYMQQKISELYEVMMVNESIIEKNGNLDPYAMLFRSASQKKAFSEYIERFEQFLIDVCTIFMDLARHYLPDDELIPVIGRSEYVNLEEFRRNESPLSHQIKIEAAADDIETQMGQQMVLNQAIQYAAQQLGPEGIAKVIESMPFANAKDAMSDLTRDRRLADNVILALDRGKPPMIHEYDKHPYMIKRLTDRIRDPDFELLSPQIRQNYMRAVDFHEQAEAVVQSKIMQAKSEFIPSGGGLVACDLYVPDPNNALSQKRVRVPQESLNWLIKQLDVQGSAVSSIDDLNPQAGSEVLTRGQQLLPKQGQPPGPAPASLPAGNISGPAPQPRTGFGAA